ncbi:hypothetical protein LIPSTDRAFT_101521 [Lipomyces starkeyi NRRL Y-11557]|uniref:Uncharacterized protein n=1 Tax=Lipomyces starkeyi NRRL Y-11557 TaxID=675824 RepID=A0A1E3QEU1_LIPST|nr:hypothetical protein LIPSTDRAFT_101521 [Lipomyces starkeyi NRRL Y-11557]
MALANPLSTFIIAITISSIDSLVDRRLVKIMDNEEPLIVSIKYFLSLQLSEQRNYFSRIAVAEYSESLKMDVESLHDAMDWQANQIKVINDQVNSWK